MGKYACSQLHVCHACMRSLKQPHDVSNERQLRLLLRLARAVPAARVVAVEPNPCAVALGETWARVRMRVSEGGGEGVVVEGEG